MEVISKDLQDRLDQVEEQIQGVQGELLRLNTESMNFVQRFKILEETDQRHQEELRSLHASQEVNKALVKQILDRFDRFEERLLGLFQQSQKDNVTERTGSQKEYLKFVTYVIGATMGAIVLHLFTK